MLRFKWTNTCRVQTGAQHLLSTKKCQRPASSQEAGPLPSSLVPIVPYLLTWSSTFCVVLWNLDLTITILQTLPWRSAPSQFSSSYDCPWLGSSLSNQLPLGLGIGRDRRKPSAQMIHSYKSSGGILVLWWRITTITELRSFPWTLLGRSGRKRPWQWVTFQNSE